MVYAVADVASGPSLLTEETLLAQQSEELGDLREPPFVLDLCAQAVPLGAGRMRADGSRTRPAAAAHGV